MRADANKGAVSTAAPTNGQLLTSPIHVTGRSDTFEAVVSLRVLDRNFHVVGTGRAMGGANGTYGNFAADVPFSTPDVERVRDQKESNRPTLRSFRGWRRGDRGAHSSEYRGIERITVVALSILD